jgi:light-regulated signal transduction histidine kinase (bacteriophytochrome)
MSQSLNSVQAKETAAQLSVTVRELEALSYFISNDLEGPVRSILGYAKLLQSQHGHHLDQEGKECLAALRSSAERMASMIDSSLYMSRLARIELEKECVDLSELFMSAAAKLQAEDPSRRVEFVLDRGLSAVCDRNLITSVVENLLQNAWKFTTPHKHPRIHVGKKEHDVETVFYVSDNGVGFDPQYVDKLFFPFERLHAAADRGGAGTGLANVRTIIERHGGRVWAEGELGRGATFFFSLPKNPAPQMAAVNMSEAAAHQMG